MLILAVAGVFSFSYVMMPAVIALAFRIGALDVPTDGRRMHSEVLPRAGGLGILIPVLVFCAVFGIGGTLLPLLAGSALMLAVGLADDMFCLSAPIKLLFQVAAALSSVLGMGYMGAEAAWAVLWVVLLTNAHNMVDGMDGLFCGCALTEALFLCGALYLSSRAGWEISLLLAAALFAFRFYNRYPAVTFAGDAGSESIGFLLGGLSLSLFGSGEGFSALSPLFLFAYPLTEVFTSVLRRVLHGRSPFAADRAHLHHRLRAKGLLVPECVFLLLAVCASLAAVGLFLSAEAFLPYAAIASVGAAVVLLRVRVYLVRAL